MECQHKMRHIARHAATTCSVLASSEKPDSVFSSLQAGTAVSKTQSQELSNAQHLKTYSGSCSWKVASMALLSQEGPAPMAASEGGCGPELPAALALCSCCSAGARPEGCAASNVGAGKLLGPGSASTLSADPRQLTGTIDTSNSFCFSRLPALQLSGAAAAAWLLPAGAESS